MNHTLTVGDCKAFGKNIKVLDHGRWYTVARADTKGKFLDGYDEANALLLAASADMFEALIELIERAEAAGNISGIPEYEKAWASVVKARPSLSTECARALPVQAVLQPHE
jgi:hypothetical protein